MDLVGLRERWVAATEAAKTIPIEFYLEEEMGWDEEKLARLTAALEERAWRGVDRAPADWNADDGDEEDEDEGDDGED